MSSTPGKYLVGVLCILGLFCAATAVAQYPTGLLEPTMREKEWLAKNTQVISAPAKMAAPLPDSIKNTLYLPPVGNQVNASCAAWAVTYYHKTYQEAREHGWAHPTPASGHVLSPAFTYNLNNTGNDVGSSMEGNYATLLNHGAAPCSLMDATTNYYLWPTEAQWRAGIPYRAQSVALINTSIPAGLVALKQHLAGGDVATFTMTLHNNFVAYPAEGPGVHDQVLSADGGGVYVPPGNLSPSHALTVIGYDDNKTYHLDDGTTRSGAFLAVNSWGTGWGCVEPTVGTAGFIWIGYEHFQDKQSGSPAYTMVDRIAYQPQAFVVFEIAHGRMLELGVKLLGGDKDAPTMMQDVMPRTGGDREMTVRVVTDATDFYKAGILSYWLQVFDADVTQFQPPKSGWINYFAMELPGLAPWVCIGLPRATNNFDNADLPGSNYGYTHVNISFFRPLGGVFEGRGYGEASHAWGDIDGDGRPEMVVCGYDGTKYAMRAYHNDGQGAFTDMDAGLPGFRGHFVLGDYNNDGKLDVALSGDDGVKTFIKIYRNTGSGRFSDSGAVLPAYASRLAWADFDGDGDLDLSFNEPGTNKLRLWRNKGNDTFADSGVTLDYGRQFAWADFDNDGWLDLAAANNTQTTLLRNQGGDKFAVTATLPGYNTGPLAWGDSNNDGRLDLILQQHYGVAMQTATRLYINNGGNNFTDSGVALPGLHGGSICWGDVDNDGRLDLAVCGDLLLQDTGNKQKTTRLYRNLGNNTFTNLDLDLPGVSNLYWPAPDSVQLVDFDGDGDLDLSLCGSGSAPNPLPRTALLFESHAAQSDGLNRPNTPPTPPATLAWSQAAPGGAVKLTWSAGSDAETTRTGGLYYNVSVGKNPGWNNNISGVYGSPFLGSRLRPTLSGGLLGVTLSPPPSGPFYFSVQTIDTGLRPSVWSAPKLVPLSGLTPGDVNRDGKVNVADLLLCLRMATGKSAVDLPAADLNGDARVDAIDALHTRSIILAATAPPADLAATGRIDTAGGVLTGAGVTLTVPAGAFTQPAEVRLHTPVDDRPFGADSISASWWVEGIPEDFRQPLTVRLTLRTGATAGSKVYGMIGDRVFIRSQGSTRWVHQFTTARKISSTVYEFTIPTPAGLAPSKPLAAADDNGYTHTWRWALVGGSYGEYSGGANAHFRIYYPASVVASGTAPIENLAQYLETAYSTLKDTWGFSYAARTKWPVDVCIKDLPAGTYGYFTSSKLGDNYGWMEINMNELANAAEMRVTAGHEFFHLVQGLYDTRNRYSKATGPSRHYWLDEATACWSEIPFSGNANYVSDVFTGNEFDPLDGMHLEGAAVAGSHGYGMSPLIKYIVGRQGTGVLARIYNDLKAGSHPVTVIARHASTSTLDVWYVNYFSEYFRGAIYPLSTGLLGAMAPNARRFTIRTADDLKYLKKFTANTPDLGAMLFQAMPMLATIPADASFYAKVEGPELSASMLRILDTNRQHLAFGTLTNPDVLKFEIPNLKSFQTAGTNLFLSVVNNRQQAPYTGNIKSVIEMGVVTEQAYAYTPLELTTANTDGYQFPTFTSAGALKGRGLSDIKENATGGLQWVDANLIGLAPCKIDLTYTAAPKATSLRVDELGGYTIYSIAGVKTYELELGNDTDPGHPVVTRTASGKFSFTITIPNFRAYSAYVYAVYDLTIKKFDAKDKLLSTQVKADQRAPLLLQFFHL